MKIQLESPWQYFRRKGLSEMRPYIPGEDLSGVSVNPVDTPSQGGMIARNPKNHEDQWYVAEAYFDDNLELAEPRPAEEQPTIRQDRKVQASEPVAYLIQNPDKTQSEAWTAEDVKNI